MGKRNSFYWLISGNVDKQVGKLHDYSLGNEMRMLSYFICLRPRTFSFRFFYIVKAFEGELAPSLARSEML